MRGGRRAGAGRPKMTPGPHGPRIRVTIRVRPDTLAQLEAVRAALGAPSLRTLISDLLTIVTPLLPRPSEVG